MKESEKQRERDMLLTKFRKKYQEKWVHRKDKMQKKQQTEKKKQTNKQREVKENN